MMQLESRYRPSLPLALAIIGLVFFLLGLSIGLAVL